MKIIIIISLIAFLAVVPSFSQESEILPTNPLKGRKVFLSKGCVNCHSIWGEGGSIGPDLGKFGMGKTLMQLAGTLWNHSPQMIEKMKARRLVRPNISGEEMGELASFLYSLNYFDEPGDVESGKDLFSKKGCIKCHSLGGVGGDIAPSLDKIKGYASPVLMAEAMWNHGPEMNKVAKELGIERPNFNEREMVDILAYINSASTRITEERKYLIPGNPDEGKKLFNTKGCIMCHNLMGKGGDIGPDLSKKELFKSVSEIAGMMWNHGSKMWSKMEDMGIQIPKFSGNEMADILSYLYFLRYIDKPGDIKTGEKLFKDKRCAVCHSIKGSGGDLGPDLSKIEAIKSPLDWASGMWNHAPAMEELLEEKGLQWPVFYGDEMRDLNAYLNEMKE